MAVVGSNIINTIDVANRLPLMKRREDAIQFKRKLGLHAVFVPSNLGGRLTIGFARHNYRGEDKLLTVHDKKLGVFDPHGNLHERDDSGDVRIDIETLRRGSGVFLIYVYDEIMDYHLYAIYEESGHARQANGKPLIPWNFWYFPFADSEKESSAWGGTELQPLQKYERAFGEKGVLAWEREHHADPRKDCRQWEGHCHTASLASVMFEDPPADGVEHNGEQFLAEELKLLAAEFVGRFGVAKLIFELPSGDRERTGHHHEKKPSQDPHGFAALLCELLETLRREIRIEGRALVVDFRDATGTNHAEVWNQAVYQYVTSYWQPDLSDPTLVDGACTLFANGDFYAGKETSGVPAVSKVKHGETVLVHNKSMVRCVNEFTVRFTPGGLFDTSSAENRWTSTTRRKVDTFAPRYAYRLEKPSKTVVLHLGNPRVDPEHVLALLPLRREFL